MPGQLFTQYFLRDGIEETSEWKRLEDQSETLAELKSAISARLSAFGIVNSPNEPYTEQDLIRPVLDLLGWVDYLPQQGSAHNEDIPDHLLFADAESKERAATRASSQERFRDALVVEESKRFGLPLDSRDRADRVQSNTPHGQILRYLSTAETVSDGRIRWGILTNGVIWRLYDHRSRPRASGYYEADLEQILEVDDDKLLRIFFLLFRRDAFTLREGATTTFLETAIAEGRRYEEQVAQDLSGVVFDTVFPRLVSALAEDPDADLFDARDAALIFLYRLLFVLYAEDRGLLPVNDPRYDDYGLRKPVRDHVSDRKAQGDTFSEVSTNYYNHLTNLFRMVDVGDASIGLPPYNGGLFSSATASRLESAKLSDALVAEIIYDLSHTAVRSTGDGTRRFVNYRDMSVQQLGSIYERLLEREPVREEDGAISVRPNPYARKDSGSFYTPQELVDLIVDQTLKPLADERRRKFEDRSRELKSDRRSQAQRRDKLVKLDPAEAVLDLKVLDPAMGSGHFLVTAVDFLSDYIAEMIEQAPTVPEWLDGEYTSPLVERIEKIRSEILKRAKKSSWAMDADQLTDQAIIRRMVLKRCIYGVDKNPLTVELAKVSLWLHSFTVGAPLSFLDHHLRCGDSLIGLRVLEARDELHRLGGLFASSAIQGAENATAGMERIEERSDADISEVQESFDLFQGVEETTADLRSVLDFVCGLRWMEAGMKKREIAAFENPIKDRLEADPQSAYCLLARGPTPDSDNASGANEPNDSGFASIWKDAKSISDREAFLHWEVAFPGVWHGWEDVKPKGGFDAVIGNPPWDQIEQSEVEWFAIRDEEVALASTGATRKSLIQQRLVQGEQLARQYIQVKNAAATLRTLVKSSGHYPMLSSGRINLYSLFVERAMSLIKPDGIVGLLTPSGIYADKTAANFFKSISTSGRLAGLFDFENRRLGTGLPPYFPDVDSRFKFCATVFGGAKRTFEETRCAFFLPNVETISNHDRCFPLAPEDFARVNPNTGTAPVFRTRRDAEITRGIYERHPVLVDRSLGNVRRAWPVRFKQGLFNMTSDSHLFRTAAQLESEGFYPVGGNRWKKGEEMYLPLYQGRMIHQFDHRANSVRVNPENVHNPYLSEQVSQAQHSDPEFLPQSQYWVPAEYVEPIFENRGGYILAFRRIARSTDVRTVVASLIPLAGSGDPLPVLLQQGEESHSDQVATQLSNLNSFALDFISRQKVQATHLDWYTVEQLPVIAPDDYDKMFGKKSARDLVRDHVLRLTYTAYDMAPFARDLGYDGEPFIWNEKERRHLRARLDALYFILYGLEREDAAYVLDTFPIVRRQDEAQFDGQYLTKDMILAYMNALAAGDTETNVSVSSIGPTP